MIELTPGSALAGFELLRLVEAQKLTPEDVSSGFGRFGHMPPDAVLHFVQTMNWVQVDGVGRLVLSEAGARVRAETSYPAQARRTLLDYARILSPPWLQNAPYGRSRVLRFAAIGAQQLLVEAEVAEGANEPTVAFWDELAAVARHARDEVLSRIGRQGERLTVAHEQRRTGKKPRWVAIDSNTDGYDVLSVRGPQDPVSLTIEVKTSTIGMRGQLHLTRGEWEVASEAEAHVFHLWDVTTEPPCLAVVDAVQMAAHVPSDTGQGTWESVGVPFRAFERHFSAAAA